MITYKNIIDTFNDIATNHYLINSFHSGFLDEVDVNKLDQGDFPILYAEPTSADMNTGELTYSFTLFVLTIIKEDLTNRDIVWSNTLQIIQDIVAEFKQNLALQTSGTDEGKKFSWVDGEVKLGLPITATPFTARFENLLTGWSINLDLTVDNKNDLCDAPIEPSDKSTY